MKPPSALDEMTGTTLLQQDSPNFVARYIHRVLGRDVDFETEADIEKVRQREDQQMFLSAMRKLAAKRP